MGAGEPAREPAREPEDLDRLFLRRASAGDVEGVVALYEPGAVLAFPPGAPGSPGALTVGTEAIRAVYADLLAGPDRHLALGHRPAQPARLTPSARPDPAGLVFRKPATGSSSANASGRRCSTVRAWPGPRG